MPKRKLGSFLEQNRKVSLVHWFRKGLRLHDNPSLKEGLKQGAQVLRCVYILDPWFAGLCEKGVNKWRFLLDCLEDLDKSLRKLNSRLFLVRGQPAEVFPRLFKEWNVTHLSFEADCEPFGKERDQVIKTLAQEAGVDVICQRSHTLYDPLDILRVNNNEPPLTYNRFQEIISLIGPPECPVGTVTAQDVEGMENVVTSSHAEKYGIPSLEELGFDIDNIPARVWIGGETEALQRLKRHLERKAWVANFERPRMSPVALHASPTSLSPYLRFGCLSSRLFYWELSNLYIKVKRTNQIPLSLHGQLLWREFFFAVGCTNPNLDQMQNNPICIQIPWNKNPGHLKRWAEGETGFPWIDAIMVQLRMEGWIHPLARHAVACFLTRGDLWISWEEGAKVFEELLLDADWSVNAGNWIWLSCSSFFQQFFHCYCPVKFGRKTDPEGEYIRKYLPILKNFPTKYIFDPWTAPQEVQEEARCIIGKDYPSPIVQHVEASHDNIEKMKRVFRSVAKSSATGLLDSVPSSKSASAKTTRARYFVVPQQPIAEPAVGVVTQISPTGSSPQAWTSTVTTSNPNQPLVLPPYYSTQGTLPLNQTAYSPAVNMMHLPGSSRIIQGHIPGPPRTMHGPNPGPPQTLHGPSPGPPQTLYGPSPGPPRTLHSPASGPTWTMHGATMTLPSTHTTTALMLPPLPPGYQPYLPPRSHGGHLDGRGDVRHKSPNQNHLFLR